MDQQAQAVLDFAISGGRPALYGAYMDGPGGSFNDDGAIPQWQNLGTSGWQMSAGRGGRGASTQQAAQTTMETLRQFYPNVTQDQMDLAAWAALNNPHHYRGPGIPAPESGGHSGTFYYGWGPGAAISSIAAQMPNGITPEMNSFLHQNWQSLHDTGRAARSSAHAADDAASGDFMDILGPALAIGSIAVGLGGLGGLFSGGAGTLTGEAAITAITEGYLAGTIAPAAAEAGISAVLANTGALATVTTGGAGMGIGDFFSELGSSVGDWFGSGGTASIESAAQVASEAFASGAMDQTTFETLMSELGRQASTLAVDPFTGETISRFTGDLGDLTYSGDSGSGISSSSIMRNAQSVARQLLGGNASVSDIAALAGKLVGNNQIANSTSDIVGDWMDEIKDANNLSPEQQQQLANLGVDRFNSNYLTPELLQTLGNNFQNDQYADIRAMGTQRLGETPYQDLIDTSSTGLQTLYNDPTANPIVAAAARMAGENAARKSSVKGHLNSGSFMAENQDALLASLATNFNNLASPMNQSFHAATGAQNSHQNLGKDLVNVAGTLNNQNKQAQIGALQALIQGNNTNWAGAQNAITSANSNQQALSGFIREVAAPAELTTNPVATGLGALYNQRGTNNARTSYGSY